VALLARSGLRARECAFVGWFGLRGVVGLYYAVVVVGAGVLSPAEERTVVWTVVVCVAISILVHGATATPLSRRLLR
jgi:NhaP-type Na+/H+ or K+/H+ antiporter